MPPRRPPPLLPKSRLLEAINAAPVDTRTQPANVFDTRVLLKNHAQDKVPALPQPWLRTVSEGDIAQTASASCLKQTLPCIGGIYMVSDDYGSSDLDSVLKLPIQNAFQASFVLPSNLYNARKSSQHVEAPDSGMLGQKVALHDLQSHVKESTAGTPASETSMSLLVLEVTLTGSNTPSNAIEQLPHLLQVTGLGQMGHSSCQLKIIIGAMGRTDLGPLLTGDRSCLDSLERTYFAGFLSSLPSSTVSAAIQEVIQEHPSGGDAYKSCKKAIAAVFSLILEAFGEDRIVWGSDLPLSNSTSQKDFKATAKELWDFNLKLGSDVACDIGLRGEALDKIFGGNAQSFLAKPKSR